MFFSLPLDVETHGGENGTKGELERMEISAVLSLGVQGVEEAYVSCRMTLICSKRLILNADTVWNRVCSPANFICYHRTLHSHRSIASP